MAEERNIQEFMATARERFRQADQEEREIRDEALIDLKFAAGDQWNPTLKADREKAGRPALTFSRCHTFIQQVANEARQNKPQIKFVPAEEGDKDLAAIYEGLARHIQYDSDAQVAYETAVEYSAGGGFGYYRFLTEYADNETFDLDLKVKPVEDPFSVYGLLIPACLGQEAQFGFVTTHITKDEYKSLYPKSEMADKGFDWEEAAGSCGDWITEERVRIAEYWVVERTAREIEKGGKRRTVYDKTVKFYKINGVEILEETEWPGSRIPIVPVLGKQMIIDGKPRLFSVIRFQRDPQMLINFYKTRIAETLGTAPIQPFMVQKGAIAAEDRAQWANLNKTLSPYLEYLPVSDITGQPVQAPQRQVFEPPINSLSAAAAQEIDDMKATAGIYDASLGAKGNEASGIAIQRRQQQSGITNLHFLDNLERSFKKGGVIIAEVLDKVYDTPRRVRILGEDEAPKIVAINQATQDGKEYRFGSTKFDVVVTMGRSFSTKRMESFDVMTSIIQANPQVFPMVADIFFKNSDLAGADQLAERFKTMLPPQVQQAEQEEGQQIPPEVQAQMAQLAQQNQELQQALQEAANPMKLKEMELEFREREAVRKCEQDMAKFEHELQLKRMDIEKEAKIAVMKHDSDEAKMVYGKESDLIKEGIQRTQEQQVQEAQEANATAGQLG